MRKREKEIEYLVPTPKTLMFVKLGFSFVCLLCCLAFAHSCNACIWNFLPSVLASCKGYIESREEEKERQTDSEEEEERNARRARSEFARSTIKHQMNDADLIWLNENPDHLLLFLFCHNTTRPFLMKDGFIELSIFEHVIIVIMSFFWKKKMVET